MADGGGAKNPIGGTFEDVGEAVVKPVTDEVGKAIEQGVQSVIQGTKQQTPQQQQDAQQKQVEEQKNLTEARRKVKYWQDLEVAQRRVREEERQKKAGQVQEEQKKKEVKQYEIVKKKQEDIALRQAVANARTKTERKGGVGG